MPNLTLLEEIVYRDGSIAAIRNMPTTDEFAVYDKSAIIQKMIWTNPFLNERHCQFL